MILLCFAALSAATATVDLGTADLHAGLRNTQRGDGTDGENAPSACGPTGDLRTGRVNLGDGDNDFADSYFYFLVTDGEVKTATQVRIAATFFDDPSFAADPISVVLHYTNAASQGRSDLENTFAEHPLRWTLSGTGRWVRHVWTVRDAGFRTFMQGTSDFRFAVPSHRLCIDQVAVTAIPHEDPQEHFTGAHYYPWYDRGRWDYRDCVTGALRCELAPPQHPKLGRYDSADPAVVAQHLKWCAAYGINVLILEFIRPGSREDIICRDVIFRSEQAGDVSFTLLYDWAIRFGGDLTVTSQKIAEACSDWRHLCRHYFTHPSYLRVQGGRPLVMIYVTRALRGDVAGLIGALRDACSHEGYDPFLAGDEFFFASRPDRDRIARWDGIFGYDAYAGRGGYWGSEATFEVFCRRTGEYAEAAGRWGVAFFPALCPGFNDRAVRRLCADNPAMARRFEEAADPTSLFRQLLHEAALPNVDSALPFFTITSFNEWHEDTQIEPTAGTAAPTSRDTSPSGTGYTQGYIYDDYAEAYLEEIRDAVLAVTGTIRSPEGPVAGALLEVLRGKRVILQRRSFSTGVYTIPRLLLKANLTYRLRVTAPGFAPGASPPFVVPQDVAITGFDITLAAQGAFVRGDVNADRSVDIADPICILTYLFAGNGDSCAARIPQCFDAADANDDGRIDVADPITALSFLFALSGALPPPFGRCGVDPTADGLSCAGYPCSM